MAKPQTIVRDGSGTQSVSYALPPGVFQYIESVLVAVNNGSASDVNPELQVATVNGVVMATKEQGRAIPAGDTGRATWALRLDDERATSSGAAGPTAIYANFAQTIPAGGGWPNGRIDFAFSSGTNFLDLATNGPDFPTFVDAGVYSIAVVSAPSNAAEPAGLRVSSVNLDVNAATSSTTSNQSAVLNDPGFTDVIGVANTQAVAAGDTLDVFVINNFTVDHDYGVYFVIQRLP